MSIWHCMDLASEKRDGATDILNGVLDFIFVCERLK